MPAEGNSKALQCSSLSWSGHAKRGDHRIEFEPSKETFASIHPQFGEGDPFELLGCLFDSKLAMSDCINKLLSEVRPKIKALLRTRIYYKRHDYAKDMITQYKTHVWSLIEYLTPAIYHASNTQLQQLEQVQTSFAHELGLTVKEAFCLARS